MKIACARPVTIAAALLSLSACSPPPAEVAASFEAAFNQGNVDGAMLLVAEGATVTTDHVRLSDKALVAKWLGSLVAGGGRTERVSEPAVIDGHTMTWKMLLASTDWTALGLAGLEHDAMMSVERGEITALRWTLTKAGQDALARATSQRNAATMRALSDSISAKNTTSVMQLLADDVMVEVMGSDPLRGKAAVSTWLASLGAQNADLLLARDQREQHGAQLWSGSMSSDAWRAIGFNQLDTHVSATFTKGGKVQTLRLTLTPEAATQLEAAETDEPATARAAPRTTPKVMLEPREQAAD